MKKGMALRPDYYVTQLPTFIKDKEAEKKGATDEERQLMAMSETAGWHIFLDYTESAIDDLDNLTAVLMSQGATEEEIGRNTIVVTLTKSIIKKLVDKVNDAKEACEESKPSGE